jgi:hypothetical protein
MGKHGWRMCSCGSVVAVTEKHGGRMCSCGGAAAVTRSDALGQRGVESSDRGA